MARTALIVGAGIGGLAAGIALRRAGWTVRIYEQSALPRELGFGLGLAANAIAALRELGVAETVLERGFRPRRGELRRMDGTVLKAAELPVEASPMIMALRPALHGALLDALGPASIAVSSQAIGFSAEEESGTLQHWSTPYRWRDSSRALRVLHRRCAHTNEAASARPRRSFTRAGVPLA